MSVARRPASRSSDCRLDLDRAGHDALQRAGVLGQHRPALALEKPEILRVRDHAVLHRLRHSRRDLDGGQRRQHVEIRDHEARLVERAQQVLPRRHVDPGLAADRRVDHGEQRGRNLDIGDAAQVGGGDEPGDVAHHAAAQRDHGAIPPELASGGADGSHQLGQLGQEPAADSDIIRRVAVLRDRDPDLHHCTSGAPAAWLATRASTNSRSDNRLR